MLDRQTERRNETTWVMTELFSFVVCDVSQQSGSSFVFVFKLKKPKANMEMN